MPNIINSKAELVDIDRLSCHPRNPRIGDVSKIKESIEVNGFYGALIAQLSTGYVLAGNHRLKAARELGMAALPVLWVDCDGETATRILLADNRTSDVGEYDDLQLAELLQQVTNDQGSLVGTGYSPVDLDGLLDALKVDSVDDVEPPEDFDEYGADLETDHQCPQCGYEWSGSAD